jgi:hypothetical protein
MGGSPVTPRGKAMKSAGRPGSSSAVCGSGLCFEKGFSSVAATAYDTFQEEFLIAEHTTDCIHFVVDWHVRCIIVQGKPDAVEKSSLHTRENVRPGLDFPDFCDTFHGRRGSLEPVGFEPQGDCLRSSSDEQPVFRKVYAPEIVRQRSPSQAEPFIEGR